MEEILINFKNLKNTRIKKFKNSKNQKIWKFNIIWIFESLKNKYFSNIKIKLCKYSF